VSRVARLVAGLVLGACAIAALAQAPARVRVFVEPDQGITDTTTVQLVVEATAQGNAELEPPALRGLVNLSVVAGPATNYNSVWSNGRFSATTRLIYTLQPDGPGPAQIPALEIKVGAAVHRSEPIRFEVAASRGGRPAAPRPEERGAARDGADVFIRAEIGSTEAWVGQAVPLSVALYTDEAPSGLAWTREPRLANFWVEDVEVDPSGESRLATVEGKRYRVFPVRRRILVPQAAGTFEIEPYAMQIQTRGRGNSPFDYFGFGRPETVVRKTQPLELRVRELPEAGRPAGFGGAVGRYTIRAELDRSETAVNDAVALTAVVEGEGFLGAVPAPELAASADLKVFDPEVASSTGNASGRLESRKTWEWVLVPLVPGEIRVPELRFVFFDPALERYETVTAALAPLVVRRSTETEPATIAQGDVRVQRRDLAFIKPLRGTLAARPARVHERAVFRALLALPLAWVPLAIVLGRRWARLQSQRGHARGRRARTRAQKRLRAARRLCEASSQNGFHEEVARALVEYVADRFDRSAAGLTYEMADELLASRGLEPELRRRYRACLEACDFARFVPSAGEAGRRGEMLQDATRLVDELERAW
jgi:hypothetical protein